MKSGRRSSRYRVHLSVSYGSASEFVHEYANNLSVGGMFIANANGLAPLDEVAVEVALPGHEPFRVQAQVCHVMSAEVARASGGKAGAGLAITKSPPGFQAALSAYLIKLGSRADYMVLASSPEVRAAVDSSGYKSGPLPDAAGLVMTIARSARPVLAVLVSERSAPEYRDAASAAGDPELVVVCNGAEDFDGVLVTLDERL